MPLKREVLDKYKSKVFVESGSLVGDAISTALNAGFEKVLSVELSEKYYNICKNKFANEPRVLLFFGDAELLFWDMIKDIDEQITFWLDGHESGGDTAKGIHGDPIMQELEIIKQHHRKDHIILVDDLRGEPNPNIEAMILEINPNYNFCFEDGFVHNDVLAARL